MHRTTRMLAIIMRLQDNSTTLQQLASDFECSTKTIQRDISELASIGIPVVTSRGRNGGVAIEPGWWMGPLNLSPDEIEAIVLALEHATHLPAAEQTLAKIRAAAKPSHFDAVAQHPHRPVTRQSPGANLPDNLAQLRNVMSRELWCKIDYSGGSNPGWRLILPIELHIAEGRWYVYAIDARSHEHRVFRLDRMRDIVPALAPADANAIIVNAKNQPEYQSEIYPEIVVNLNERAIQFCHDHHHFHRCLVGDQLRFRCPPGEYRYVAREVLRMGTDCHVLAPPGLIKKLRELISEIGQHLDINQDVAMS